MSYPDKITRSIPDFKYFSPKTVAEAVSILTQGNGSTKVLAGGTDLLNLIRVGTIRPEIVVSINSITDLSYIREDDSGIRIGTLTKISQIQKSDLVKTKCFALYEATQKFASVPVRNMATIGGNICRSSPSADCIPPLMALDSRVKVTGSAGERYVSLGEFFTGPGENILRQEILTEILIPKQEKLYGTAFEKIMRNSADLAKVNCAVWLVPEQGKCSDIRIILGAVGPTPIRARHAEQIMGGADITEDIIEQAGNSIIEDICPITDVRSTAEYRAEVSKVLVKRLIKTCVERARQ